MSKQRKSGIFRRHTPQVWSDLQADFERWARERCAAGAGRIFLNEAQAELRLGQQTARRLADEAIAAGWLVERSARTGFGVCGLVPPENTLADLVDFARGHTSGDANSQKGRQRADGAREIKALSNSQLVKVCTVCGFVAKKLTGDRRRLSAVSQEQFRWLENGGVGANGSWELVDRVREWAKDESDSTREAHVAAVRNLLDLCATLGRITRGVTPRVVLAVEAVEWEPWVQRTADQLAQDASAVTRYEVQAGARVLARFATRRGHLDADRVDWRLLVEDLERARDCTTDPLPIRHFRLAYTAYRKLRRAGLIEGPDLRGSARPENPAGLVPFAAIKAAAASGDFAAWRTRDGRLATALTTDLLRWRLWAGKGTTNDTARSMKPPLPPRERLDPTATEAKRAARRRQQGRPEFRLSQSSITTALTVISDLAGWAADHESYDPEKQGLEALINLERFDRRTASWLETHDRPAESRGAYLSSMAAVLGTVASPFLEREAHQRGDSEAQNRLRATGVNLQLRAIELKPLDGERADALDKVRPWETDGTDGWSKLNRLCDILEERVVREADGRSLELQSADIQKHSFRPRRLVGWAVAVRDVVFVNLIRRVPLRGENASGLRLLPFKSEHRRDGRTFTRTLMPNWSTTDPGGCPWRGAIQLSFDAGEVKQGTTFEASFITPREVGQADAEKAIRRSVLQLYLMPGGARDILLQRPDGTAAWSPYLFPVAARNNTKNPKLRAARHYRWSRATASTRFTELLLRHSNAMSLNFGRLRGVFGAGSLHVIRHLFGTHFVAVGNIKHASLMLGHANTQITEEIYSGISTANISVDEMERQRTAVVEAGQGRATTVMSHRDEAMPDFASETLELISAYKSGMIDQSVLTGALEALQHRYGRDGADVRQWRASSRASFEASGPIHDQV